MSGLKIRAGGAPALLLKRLYRKEQQGKWPTDRPCLRHLHRLLELDYVRWPAGGTGTLTEAGRIAARALEAGS